MAASVRFLRVLFRPRYGHPGVFEARLEGQSQILAISHQPFLEAARALLSMTLADPEIRLVGRHEGETQDCLSAVLIDAARCTVVERAGRLPMVETWRPYQLSEGLHPEVLELPSQSSPAHPSI